MSYYPNDFVEQVRLTSDIVSLISEDTNLKGRGDQFMGLCPFPEHSEKTPSFSVSSSKQLYHCFGCQNAGNIFTYLQKQRGMNFTESIEYLARKSGLPLPQKNSIKKAQFNPSLLDLSEKICQFYERELKKAPAHSAAQAYLQKRGWTKDTVHFFRLGYAPKNNSLLSFLKTQKEKEMAGELGLLNQSNRGELYDNFRQRLIFPILSVRKQVIGFGARVLNDSLPKYINSKESPLFHKGKIFYGLHESARYLRQQSFALVVEGYTDFLSLWQEGFKNIVATLGTALTRDQARLLKKQAPSVILVFDGDEAGLKASERSLPLLLNEGLDVKFLSLPKGQDPDDFIRLNGKKAFQSRLQSAKSLFFFVLQKKYEDLKKSGKEPFYLIEEMAPLLAKTQNTAFRDTYRQRLLDLFGSDARLMSAELNKKMKILSKTPLNPAPMEEASRLKKTPTKSNSALPQEEALSLSKTLEAERILLILCLESEAFLKEFLEGGFLSLLKTSGIIKIFNKIEKQYRQCPHHFDKLIHLIMNEISDPSLIFKANYPILKSAPKENQRQIFQDCLNFLRKRQKRSSASVLIAEMKMDHKEDMRRMEKVFQLTKQRLKQADNQKIEEKSL